MVHIYILKLEQGKYYVGKTINPSFRLNSHFNANGSAWTKLYKPIKMVELIPDCDDYDEDKYTRMFMDKYGVDNVRGGSFVSVELPKTTIDHLQQMKNGTKDNCFTCGKSGHFAKDCKNEKKNKKEEIIWCCEYCDKEFIDEKKCEYHEKKCKKNKKKEKMEERTEEKDELCDCPTSYFSKHRKSKCIISNILNAIDDSDDWETEDEEDSDEKSDDEEEKNNVVCFRCGREGHYANSCYASKHIRGYYLK